MTLAVLLIIVAIVALVWAREKEDQRRQSIEGTGDTDGETDQ